MKKECHYFCPFEEQSIIVQMKLKHTCTLKSFARASFIEYAKNLSVLKILCLSSNSASILDPACCHVVLFAISKRCLSTIDEAIFMISSLSYHHEWHLTSRTLHCNTQKTSRFVLSAWMCGQLVPSPTAVSFLLWPCFARQNPA